MLSIGYGFKVASSFKRQDNAKVNAYQMRSNYNASSPRYAQSQNVSI